MSKRILLVLALALPLTGLRAQNVNDLIIAEALAVPDSTGIVDEYGRREGWIELFNTSQGTVNFAGCYLTNDRNNLKKSLIPKGDLRTKLGPRQSVLLFASGNGKDGTFYADFTLRPGSTVYLVSNDGRTVIDSLVLPASLPEGMSMSKRAFDLRQRAFEPLPEPTVPSPGIFNGDTDAATKAQAMTENDPHGGILSLVSVTVVFSALAILWFLFWLLFDRPARRRQKQNQMAGQAGHDDPPVIPGSTGNLNDEVAAAIALAMDMEQGGEDYAAIALAMDLYLGETVHDAESFVLTMRPRESSGWNDKGQNFRKLPR